MIFLGIAIPIGILLGLLLFFSGLYSRNRLAVICTPNTGHPVLGVFL